MPLMRRIGIAVATVMILLSLGSTGDHRPVRGLGMTGGQSAWLAIACAVTGIILLGREKT